MSPDPELTPAEDTFALVSHSERMVLYRNTSGGISHMTSRDGIEWTPASADDGLAGLRVLCAAEGAPQDADDAPLLFCLNPDGAVRPARLTNDGARVEAAFRPAPDPGPWYEAAPRAEDMAIEWDGSRAVYRAFFCARRSTGRAAERRGCIGAAVSRDLAEWSLEPPLFAPNRFSRLAAPHVVLHEGRTCLFYASEESGALRAIRAAVALHAEGPYESLTPDVVSCDCRRSIHTAPLGAQRLVFFARRDPLARGALSLSRPGRLEMLPNGRLSVRFHDPLLRLMGKPLLAAPRNAVGSSEILVRMLPRYGRDYRLTARLRRRSAAAAGIAFRTTVTGSDNITLWLDFEANALLLRRGVRGRLLARTARDLRSQDLHRLALWVEGPFVDVFHEDEWVLSAHTEALRSGAFGLAVRGGEAEFEDLAAHAIV